MFQVYMLQPMTSACDLFGAGGRRCSAAEPGLDELMSDPMTLALMQADGVDRHEFDALVAQVRENLL